MRAHFLFSSFILLAAGNAVAAQRPDMPNLAETTEEIVKAAEGRKGFGHVESKTLEGAGREMIAVWYCPFSGEDSSYLHVYHFDEQQKRWVRFVDKLVHHAHRLTAELVEKDENLVFKGPRGDVVDTESIAALPKKK